MRKFLPVIILVFLFLACGQGAEKAPPPEKGLILNPETDTLPDKEILGPEDDDDLSTDEIIEEEK